jgi:glycosyltransferase involved in cell wall biosynthesis
VRAGRSRSSGGYRSRAGLRTVIDATIDGETPVSVALCPHLSLEHYRGGEKWVATLANELVADGIGVAVHALPYAPGGERRVAVRDVLDERVPYREAWRHDLSGYDRAYVFYNPFSEVFFHGATTTIAGIHSWAYVSRDLYESHYGVVPTAVKALYRLTGARELGRFDGVHSVTPAYESPHPNTVSIPNFVDTDRFRPDRAPRNEDFTVLTTAAHIPEKGWETIRAVAARLADRAALGEPEASIRVVTTGEGDDRWVSGLGFLDEDELADAYARAHVVLHPARVDTDSMVINEACASGTPVVTTPIATHVRENEAVLHGGTVERLCTHIENLRRERANGMGYDRRCRRARIEGEAHSMRRVYPRLKHLLTAEIESALEPVPEPVAVDPAEAELLEEHA